MKKRFNWKSLILVVAIILLGVGVCAAITNGFTEKNPYGWLDKKSDIQLKEDDVIVGFKLLDGDIDMAALKKALKKVDEVESDTTWFFASEAFGNEGCAMAYCYNDEADFDFIGLGDFYESYYMYFFDKVKSDTFELSKGWYQVVYNENAPYGCLYLPVKCPATIEFETPFYITYAYEDLSIFSKIMMPIKGDPSLLDQLKEVKPNGDNNCEHEYAALKS